VVLSDTTQGCLCPNSIHGKQKQKKKFKEHVLSPVQAMFNWSKMEMDEVQKYLKLFDENK
jgi:hypothetical protein